MWQTLVVACLVTVLSLSPCFQNLSGGGWGVEAAVAGSEGFWSWYSGRNLRASKSCAVTLGLQTHPQAALTKAQRSGEAVCTGQCEGCLPGTETLSVAPDSRYIRHRQPPTWI